MPSAGHYPPLPSQPPRPPGFEDAFEKLKATVSPSDGHDFHSTTLQDVWCAVQDIERQLAARKALRNIRRVMPLLESLKLISGPVEVLCNGTPYLPWIWAPIKLTLQLASQYSEILEKLLEAYAQIGNAMPRFDRFNKAFSDSASVQHILSVIYADILEFHRRAYKFFRRRGWRNFFHSSWASFDIRFKTIIDSLDKHSDWLDREANSLDIIEAREWRRKLQDDAGIREKDRSDIHFQDALTWLAVDDQEDELDRLSDRCQPDTCNWLFKHEKVVSWCNDEPIGLLLWLKGIPGSGKSVLCSQLINHLKKADDCMVAFYLCNSYSNQNHCLQILKSIAAQLLRSHREMASYVVHEFASQGQNPSITKLRKLLANMQRKKTRIVVDGLDEIEGSEHSQVITELDRLTKVKDASCKVLISSREDSTISKLLRQKATLSLTDEQEEIHKAIEVFINHEIRGLKDRFKESVLATIAQKLIGKAGGMFLWVRLVIATFEDVYSIQELHMAVDSLPKGLDGAYGRIIERIQKDMSEGNRAKTVRILSWIAFSCRPLKVHELLDGVTLHEDNLVLNEISRLEASVLELCKPIIEETHGNVVEFVHFSAKE